MCLLINKKESYIAKEPIYVYKVLLKTKYKPYKLLPFYKKIKYTTPIYIATVKKGCILKASDPDSTIKFYCGSALIPCYCIEEQGVHAFIKENDADFFNQVNEFKGVITLWKIPAGIKYWISSSTETIAATEMQFIKVLH